MTEWHPDRETLEGFLDDQLPEEQSRTLQRHIFTCSRCEERLIGILPSSACGDGEDTADAANTAVDHYRDLFRQVLREARQEGEQRRVLLAAERKEAARLWREIRGLDLAARRELLWDDSRFQSWGFFELLLDKARWTVLETRGRPRR
jgi:anti-sigma factor RsiW